MLVVAVMVLMTVLHKTVLLIQAVVLEGQSETDLEVLQMERLVVRVS